MDQKKQHLVNAALMKRYTGQPVRIWLNVGADNSVGGRQLEGTSSDKKLVKVNLSTPLNQPLNGWVEVAGSPNANGSIDCTEIIVFQSDENSEPFDEEAHNAIILTMDNMRDFSEIGDA